MQLEVTKTLAADLLRPNTGKTILAKQQDVDTRRLKITVTQDGVPFVVPTGTLAQINIRRADGKRATFSAQITTEGCVSAVLPLWALKDPGILICDLSLVAEGNARLSTSHFFI